MSIILSKINNHVIYEKVKMRFFLWPSKWPDSSLITFIGMTATWVIVKVIYRWNILFDLIYDPNLTPNCIKIQSSLCDVLKLLDKFWSESWNWGETTNIWKINSCFVIAFGDDGFPILKPRRDFDRHHSG